MGDLGVITFRCCLCWAEFDTPAELAQHEQQEDEGLYDLDLSEAGES